MKKVYVLTYVCNSKNMHRHIEAIFETRERAEKEIEMLGGQWVVHENREDRKKENYWKIEEWEILK